MGKAGVWGMQSPKRPETPSVTIPRQRNPTRKPSGTVRRKTPFNSRKVGIGMAMLWLWGGNSNNGSNCGLVYSNSNNVWTNSNANISARFTSNQETIRTLVVRHAKASGHSEPRRLVRKYSQCQAGTNRTCAVNSALYGLWC